MKRFLGLWLLVVVSLFLVAVATANGGGDKVTRHRPAVAFVQDPTGGMTPYNNPAAYGWHPGSLAPDRPDGEMDPATGKYRLKWPIVAEYTTGGIPSVVWYWDKSFRTSNGYKWGKPLRWAYLRMVEEVWNPTTGQFDVPGLATPSPAPTPPATDHGAGGVHMDDIAGQQIVDLLKRSFTTTEIQDKIDASPYDEPDTGAPEDGPGAPPL